MGQRINEIVDANEIVLGIGCDCMADKFTGAPRTGPCPRCKGRQVNVQRFKNMTALKAYVAGLPD